MMSRNGNEVPWVLAAKTGNAAGKVLAAALDSANGRFLDNDKSPSRKVGGIANRGSHYYLALYWAQALAEQSSDATLHKHLSKIARQLAEQESTSVAELRHAQGKPVDIGGYYHPDRKLAEAAMRPSPALNAIIVAI